MDSVNMMYILKMTDFEGCESDNYYDYYNKSCL
jgi:hypothetical protein